MLAVEQLTNDQRFDGWQWVARTNTSWKGEARKKCIPVSPSADLAACIARQGNPGAAFCACMSGCTLNGAVVNRLY